MVDETESNCLPPWLETTTADAPSSTARLASSAISRPLITIGPDQLSRIQCRSFQLTAPRDNDSLTFTMSRGPCPGTTTFSSLGTPPSSRNEMSHPGCKSKL